MREIGEAQDRIGERDADRAEPDHGADQQAVGDELQVHGAARGRRPLAAEIERGRSPGRASSSAARPSWRLLALRPAHRRGRDGERGARILLDQQDGHAGVADLAGSSRRPSRPASATGRPRPRRASAASARPSARGRPPASAAGRRRAGRRASRCCRARSGKSVAASRRCARAARSLRAARPRRAAGSPRPSSRRRRSRSAARRRGRWRTISCGFRPVMSSPSRCTRPENFGTSPATALISVDLPAPFGPRMATISPRATRMLAPRTIGTPGS